jgi:hypothetical protein
VLINICSNRAIRRQILPATESLMARYRVTG